MPRRSQGYDRSTMLRGVSPLATLAMVALLAACSESSTGDRGPGGSAGTGGEGGSGGNDLGIDDPSDHFDLVDPQEDVEGMDLALGTETALPPDEKIRAFFSAIESSGGDTRELFESTTTLGRSVEFGGPFSGSLHLPDPALASGQLSRFSQVRWELEVHVVLTGWLDWRETFPLSVVGLRAG